MARLPKKAAAVLELRPTCEHCNKALPADSTEARICSYECTFCAHCVETVLGNVCPNCGGGFAPRPIRPARNLKGDNFLGKDPAGTVVPAQSGRSGCARAVRGVDKIDSAGEALVQ